MPQLYPLPAFLVDRISREQYIRWLQRKAEAHVKRDRLRSPAVPITVSGYKQQIHAAVAASNGVDWYTDEALEWEKISTYNNDQSKLHRSVYKAGFALLPSVDHVLGEEGRYDFVICGWRTNDAKNDLSLPDFLHVCRKVLAKHGA
jgi:hypothetical protein